MALQRLIALTESRRALAEVRAAIRLRDEVLSVVSHDLRNPISTVAMRAALLHDHEIQLTDDEKTKELEIIRRSPHRMNRLIQDLRRVVHEKRFVWRRAHVRPRSGSAR